MKERCPSNRKCKLHPRAGGPFPIVGKINDNKYQVEFSGDYGVSSACNVVDLSPYHGDDVELPSLIPSSSREEEYDGGPSTPSTPLSLVKDTKLINMVVASLDEV